MPVAISRKFKVDYLLLFIIFLSVMSFARMWFLHDIYEDDNCWLISIYTSNNLREFLDTGFTELRREPMGTFLYYFFRLHRTLDSVFLVWQSVNIGIQIISSIFLYLFLKSFLRDIRAAFLVVVCFTICTIDRTMPVFSNLPYQLGLMLAIISFFFIRKALAAETTNWAFFSAAIICSGIAQYILMEGVIALEPARLFVIGYVLFEKKVTRRILSKKAVKLWLPFCFLCIPLIIYKLANKPYGIYEGNYPMNPFFLFDMVNHIKVIRHILLYPIFFLKQISHVSLWSIGLGFCTFVFGCLILKYIMITTEVDTESYKVLPRAGLIERWKGILRLMKFEYLFGIFLLVPPVLFYEFVGLVPSYGPNSRHAIILKFGYAVMLGTIVCGLFELFYASWLRIRILLIVVSLVIAGGVFINNLNLDIYFRDWSERQAFWKAFTTRFPSLPDNVVFLTDVEVVNGVNNFNLDTSYDFEFVLNMLYARSTNPADFRSYKVINIDEWTWLHKPCRVPFVRVTAWGRDIIDPTELIVVHYANNKLFVNREIIEQYPNAPYHILLNKDFPALPSPHHYPLRVKMKWSDLQKLTAS